MRAWLGSTLSAFAAAALLCAPAAAHGKEGGKDDKEPPVVWQDRAVPGPGVTLRLKRAPGKCLIYEGSLERAQQSSASYSEEDTFYLTVLCVEQVGALDHLAIRRTYLTRKRVETLESGKKVDRVLENTDDLVNLGPNFSIVNALRCYAYDSQNRVAYRTEQLLNLKDGRQLRGSVLSEDQSKLTFLTGEEKLDVERSSVEGLSTIPQPHVCVNDTPHYLFPLFSERAVAPGDTWRFKVPVLIPLEQGIPPRVLPTQFTASLIGRLREVRAGGGPQVAVVDYQVSGAFDSDSPEYRARFPKAFHEMNQVIHKMSGTGTVSVDVQQGRILEKAESFTFMLYGRSVIPQPADKPAKQEEKRAELVSRYQIKLLPPGTRLKNGKVIPDYD